MAAPVAHTASGSTWPVILAVGGGCLVLCFLLRKDLYQPGPWLGAARRLWAGVVAGEMLHWIAAYWPNQRLGVVGPLALLVLSAWAAGDGEERAERVGCVLFWPLILLLGAILASGLPEVKLSNLSPSWRMPERGLITTLLLPTFACGQRTGKKAGFLAGLLAAALLASVVAMGVLSPGAKADTPLYELSRSLSLLGVGERFESLAAAGMTLGYFVTMTYLLRSGERTMEEGKGIWISAAVAGGLYLFNIRLNSGWIAMGSVGIWVFFPVLGMLKNKLRKSQKSA